MNEVSVIIPHAGGREILTECLAGLASSVGVSLETIIVDNGSDDAEEVARAFSGVQILRFPCMLGFSVACNKGVEAATAPLVFLLNNDAVVEPDTIRRLVTAMNSDPAIAAVQPKILSYADPQKFDYSSAAGGELDLYGYPFARGRLFDHIESDEGQYDDDRDCFWGAGAALMVRRELYLSAGGLAEIFYAHMEEIDLQWRLHLMGYRVRAIGNCSVRHRGAVTIKSGSFLKLYLNHRNSLALLVRNYSYGSLAKFLPIRLILDGVAAIYAVFCGNFIHSAAILRANCWFFVRFFYLIRLRGAVQRLRVVPDSLIRKKLYNGSVVWDFFYRKRQTWRQLHWKN